MQSTFHRDNENNLKKVFIPTRISDVLNDSALRVTDHLLNAAEKKQYIAKFISTPTGKSLGYKNVESVYSRIEKINSLLDITDEPLLLMMTLHVLDYLEEFYDKEGVLYEYPQVVHRDIFHLFTELMIREGEHKISLENNQLTQIGKNSVYECIFNYTVDLAQFSARIRYKKERSNGKERDDDEQEMLRALFCRQYDATMFGKPKYYEQIKIGREGSPLLRMNEESGQFTFIHPDFEGYFEVLTTDCIRGRRQKTNNIIDEQIALTNSMTAAVNRR